MSGPQNCPSDVGTSAKPIKMILRCLCIEVMEILVIIAAKGSVRPFPLKTPSFALRDAKPGSGELSVKKSHKSLH